MEATCPKCNSPMEEGFILDSNHGERLVSHWVEGKPEKGFFWGIKVKGRRQLEVMAMRCTVCGFLESYARKR